MTAMTALQTACASLTLVSMLLSAGCLRLPAAPAALSPSYRHFPEASSHVFLTFDAHPCGAGLRSKCDEAVAMDGAWQLLDTLRSRRVHSTFFFTGQFIEQYPEISRRVLEDGHEIGSHLKTHMHPLELESRGIQFSREWFQEELLSADAALVAATGRHTVKLFRMPYGLSTYTMIPGVRRILAWSFELGYTHVDWTVDTLDWVSKDSGQSYQRYLTAKQMEERIVSAAGSGPVVLSHLTRYRSSEEDSVNEALPDLLSRLGAMNVTPRRVSDFLPEPGSEIAAEAAALAERPGGSGITEGLRECSYVWNFRRLHICVQGMRDDCASLEGAFLKQEQTCACTPKSSQYTVTNLGEIVQVTCTVP